MKQQFQLRGIGRELREARVAKGWSQCQLSARSGKTQASISKVETGQVDLQVSSLVELGRFLDLEMIEAIVRDTHAQRASHQESLATSPISERPHARSRKVEGPLRGAGSALRDASRALQAWVRSKPVHARDACGAASVGRAGWWQAHPPASRPIKAVAPAAFQGPQSGNAGNPAIFKPDGPAEARSRTRRPHFAPRKASSK